MNTYFESLYGNAHYVNMYLHIGFGAITLLLGLVALTSSKGGKVHRKFGGYFSYAYSVVLITAVIGVLFFRTPPALAAVTLAASYGFLSGVRSLKNKISGPQITDHCFSVIALILCVYLILIMNRPGTQSWPPAMGYSVIGFTTFYAVYDLSRALWKNFWIAKIWPIDHGVKLVGSYFAAASAASGNLVQSFQPWSQIAPSLLSSVLIIYFLVWYFRKPIGLNAR